MSAAAARPGRNDPCHCGSGKKYKKCHLADDAEADRAARAEAQPETPAPEPIAEGSSAKARDRKEQRRATDQPWRRSQTPVHGTPGRTGPRRRGGS